jgi:hypothetical protein
VIGEALARRQEAIDVNVLRCHAELKPRPLRLLDGIEAIDKIRPAGARTRPETMPISVLFPAPFGPSRSKKQPGGSQLPLLPPMTNRSTEP